MIRGIVFNIQRYSINDGPGIRTTVFLKGCPLDCWWCHNPESKKSEPEVVFKANRFPAGMNMFVGRELSAAEVMTEIDQDAIFYDESSGGVTFSGGEPLLQFEFLKHLLLECRDRGYHTAVDTSGHAPREVFEEIVSLVDLFLYDLKIIDAQEHLKYMGCDNELIIQNLDYLSSMGKKIWIRIPIIPDINDTEANLHQIVQVLNELPARPPVYLLPYNRLGSSKCAELHQDYRLKYIVPPTGEQMKSLQNFFKAHSFTTMIGG